MTSGRAGIKTVTKTLADGTRKTYTYEKKAKPSAAGRYPTGSLGSLITLYRCSPEFGRLRPKTKKNYLRYLGFLDSLYSKAFTEVRRKNIITLRNSVVSGYGNAAANCFSGVVSVLFSWARENGHLDVSPADRIRKLEGGHYPAWTNDQAREAMNKLPEHFRRVILLGMLTGQRRGDLIKMTWNNYDGSILRITQEKTGMVVAIPVDSELKAELDSWKRKSQSLLILTTQTGLPWVGEYLSKKLAIERKKIGLPAGLNVHGLRKLRAANLAEAGCSTHEIASHTGHKTLAMVQLYTESVSREALAKGAVVKMETAARKLRETGS